jgi:hypothetical protein
MFPPLLSNVATIPFSFQVLIYDVIVATHLPRFLAIVLVGTPL